MFTLTSLTGGDVTISPAIVVPAENSIDVTDYSIQIENAKNEGLISVSYTQGVAPLVTDNTTGTAGTDYTLAAITDAATAANAIATLSAIVNELSDKLNSALARASKLP